MKPFANASHPKKMNQNMNITKKHGTIEAIAISSNRSHPVVAMVQIIDACNESLQGRGQVFIPQY
jgi:hypothetical protein